MHARTRGLLLGALAAAIVGLALVVFALRLALPLTGVGCTTYVQRLPEVGLMPTQAVAIRSLEAAPPPSGARLVILGGSSGGIDSSPQPPQARWYFRMPNLDGDISQVDSFFANWLLAHSWTAEAGQAWTKGDAKLTISNQSHYLLPGFVRADDRYWLAVESFGSTSSGSIHECRNDDKKTYLGN